MGAYSFRSWGNIFADLAAEQAREDALHPHDLGALNSRQNLEDTAAFIAAELENV